MELLKVFSSLAVVLIILHTSDAVRCKAGTPTLGKLTPPNLPDTVCEGPNFEDMCYVMFTDYIWNQYDAWTYGCILKGSLNKCNKSFKTTYVTNNYCCCTDALCNDKDFAQRCGQKSDEVIKPQYHPKVQEK